jgi:hypothetical protein
MAETLPTKKSGTVTVASKLPHSIELQLYKAGEYKGPQGEDIMVKNGPPVVINGANSLRLFNPRGGYQPEDLESSGGYGLTPGVDAEMFAAWVAQHKGTKGIGEALDQKLIFAQDGEQKAADAGVEAQGQKSGFEPLNPDALPAGVEKAE